MSFAAMFVSLKFGAIYPCGPPPPPGNISQLLEFNMSKVASVYRSKAKIKSQGLTFWTFSCHF